MLPTPVFWLGEFHEMYSHGVTKSQMRLRDIHFWGFFPGSSVGKESSCNAGNPGLIPGWGKSAGEGIRLPTPVFWGLACGSAGEESVCNAGDLGSIPGLGKSPGEGKGYPFQYSGLENSMDRIKSMGSQRVGHYWATFTSLHSKLHLLDTEIR